MKKEEEGRRRKKEEEGVNRRKKEETHLHKLLHQIDQFRHGAALQQRRLPERRAKVPNLFLQTVPPRLTLLNPPTSVDHIAPPARSLELRPRSLAAPSG